jgi:MFS family permease
LVCDKTSTKSLFTTLYFIGGLVGILPSGILADRFGRKTISYAFIIASSISYILMSILLNIPWLNITVQIYLFGTLRLFIGMVSTFYPIATVLGRI